MAGDGLGGCGAGANLVAVTAYKVVVDGFAIGFAIVAFDRVPLFDQVNCVAFVTSCKGTTLLSQTGGGSIIGV